MKKFANLTHINKTALILLIIGVGIGLLVMTQFKTKPTRVSNPITPYVSLRDTRDRLITEQGSLKQQITGLQNQITEKQNELKKYQVAKKNIEEVEKDKEKVGLTETKGQGVRIVIDDAKKSEATVDSIAHAADLRDLTNFLWSIGAEAISINNERIVFPTSIDCIVNTILINSTKTTPPFEIKAIGDSKMLAEQLNNSNNLDNIKKRAKSEGLVFEINQVKDLTIDSYKGSYSIKNTKISE